MKYNFDSEFYEKVFNRINSNIYVTDTATDEIVYMNDYMKQTFDLKEPEGKICWQVLQKDMTGRCEFCKINGLERGILGDNCIWIETNTMTGRSYMNKDMLEKWQGHVYHIQNSVDITEQVRLSMEAAIDELTGVSNRSAGKKQIEKMLREMNETDMFIAVLCDVNDLKAC